MNVSTKPLYEDRFVIEDDVDPPISGWTDGTIWNGWAMPYFERTGAEHVVEAFNRRIELMQGVTPGISRGAVNCGAWYDLASDAFCFRQTAGEDPECYASVIMPLDGMPVRLYPIGRGEWIWDSCNES